LKKHRVFFGGSFNPPHHGHLDIIKELVKKSEIDAIHIVPTSQNPLKTEALKKYNSLLVLHAFFNEAQTHGSSEKIQLELLEWVQKDMSYTIESLRALYQNYAESEWSLVLGSDCLESFHLWKNAEKLIRGCKSIYVFKRSDHDIKNLDFFQNKVIELPQVRSMSSTQIRKFIEDKNLDQLEESLPPRVFKELAKKLN